MNRAKYAVADFGRPGNKTVPGLGEYYGHAWLISLADDPRATDPVVIVPDFGDGLAKPLAEKIALLLSEGGLPQPAELIDLTRD